MMLIEIAYIMFGSNSIKTEKKSALDGKMFTFY